MIAAAWVLVRTSKSILSSSFTLTVPPATLTGVIPNSRCGGSHIMSIFGLYIHDHGMCDAVQRELAADEQTAWTGLFDARRFKLDLWEAGDIQNIGAEHAFLNLLTIVR